MNTGKRRTRHLRAFGMPDWAWVLFLSGRVVDKLHELKMVCVGRSGIGFGYKVFSVEGVIHSSIACYATII